ncbi:MAG: carbohydrate binding domain-containing protein [Opitutaceae bacterium]|jgi:hypothetical protein|nr:carbohydrate binding domain-containing protein [Opitutaceae bacterium]
MHLRYALTTALVLLSSLALPAGIPVENPGFESSSLAPWTWGTSGGADATGQIDTNTCHSGNASFRITNASPRGPNVFASLKQKITGLQPDTRYTISLWVKAEELSPAGKFGNAWIGGGPGWKFRHPLPAGTWDWQRITRGISTGPNQTTFDLILICEGTVKNLWVDDFQLDQTSSATTSATSTAPPGQTSASGALTHVIDGGFEQPDAPSWRRGTSGNVDVDFSFDSTEKHSGNTSARLSAHGTFGAGIYGAYRQHVKGLTKGARYQFSVWTKGQNVGAAWVGGGPGWKLRRNLPRGTWDWQRVTTSFTAESSEFEIVLLVSGQATALWFDDVEITGITEQSHTASIYEPAVWDGLAASLRYYPLFLRGGRTPAPAMSI